MQNQRIKTIVQAAKKDYSYWNSIRESSESITISRATAFYVRFIEKIINGLNAIAQYHHAEEFVSRFIERKHFFSLKEDEFFKFSKQLANEMVASGNSPNGQYSSEAIIAGLTTKITKWYYLLDSYENKAFQQDRDTISDIIAYDLTRVFYPSNLDRALLYSYFDQFSFTYTEDTVLLAVGHQMKLDSSFLYYLIFQTHIEENWESADIEDSAQKILQILKQITTAETNSLDLQKIPYKKIMDHLKKNHQKELKFLFHYLQFEKKIQSFIVLDSPLSEKSTDIYNALIENKNFPSNNYADESIQMYLEAKLDVWDKIINKLQGTGHNFHFYTSTLTKIIANDLIRIFCNSSFDQNLIKISKEVLQHDKNILLIISGQALKLSDKFIKYSIFQDNLPYWDELDDLQNPENRPVIALKKSINLMKDAYHKFYNLPRSQYARLTKAFTSYYSIKKIIELYFENEYAESFTSKDGRIDELYRKYVSKNTELATDGQIQQLARRVQRQTRFLSEEDFDEVLYYLIQADMDRQEITSLEQYLSNDKNREKIQRIVFQRFDEFTFNRINNKNIGGLANLFGTKGFIILIEAYLIGSGVEFLINHLIIYFAKNIEAIGLLIHDLFFSTKEIVLINYFILSEAHILPNRFNFSFGAFAEGWRMMEWGKTALSLLIPIGFMMLITAYNYFFHNLNRKKNREKAFNSLARMTKSWLNGVTHIINFSTKKNRLLIFEVFRVALLVTEVYLIIKFLIFLKFEPTQIGLFFFLLTTICLSAYQGNKLKEEVTLGQSETISDTVRDIIFIPILEIGKFLSGQAKSLNFIPWLVKEGVEPLYKPVVMVLQSFIAFQKEKRDELI